MSNFEQTLAETKANFSYNIDSKPEKLFAKFKSTKPDDRDMHGSTWDERALLEVGTVDLDSRQCVLTNANGFEWIAKIDLLVWCNSKGERICRGRPM